nr:hypothetical protein [Tanacetum cinerariifolium]
MVAATYSVSSGSYNNESEPKKFSRHRNSRHALTRASVFCNMHDNIERDSLSQTDVIGIHVMLLPEPVFFVICLIMLKETLCPKQAASALGKRPLSTTSFSHAYAAWGVLLLPAPSELHVDTTFRIFDCFINVDVNYFLSNTVVHTVLGKLRLTNKENLCL